MNENTKDDDYNRRKNQEQYNNILENYAKNTKCSNCIKNLLKITFFLGVTILMISFVKLLWYHSANIKNIIDNFDNKKNIPIEIIIESLAGIIASLTTVIISVMKLPKIIAEYLFNPKDEKNMISVIKKIQNYDTHMFFLQSKIDDFLMDEKSQQKSTEILNKIDILEKPNDNFEKHEEKHNKGRE